MTTIRLRFIRALALAALIPSALAWGCFTARQTTAADPGQSAILRSGEVRSGLNDRFVDPDLEVDRWLAVFETESREIFSERRGIVDRLKLRPGMAIADVGAGTGLFLEPFADGVGPQGKVYAVDISPRLVDFMQERAREAGWSQVETVLCSERSVDLEDASVDVVFSSDTYHHFEYPEETLASIHRALRRGGRFVVIDFERIPGQSREWVVDHVRAGKETVIAEIESAGFRLDKELNVPGLRENYMLQFRKR